MGALPAPILMVGAGHMGGALIAGWRGAGVFGATDFILCDPRPGEAALAAERDGALLNPPPERLSAARMVVMAVKPQVWSIAAGDIARCIDAATPVVSIMAGVESAALSSAFGGRAVARVMPNMAAAIGQGAASLFCADPALRGVARAMFEPIATVVELADESQLHAATAVSGSAPAYLYALIEALEEAGAALGLPPASAARLAGATIAGAAAYMARTATPPAELRRQVTSPGGTTQAALDVLLAADGLGPLMERTARAAAARSAALGAPPP